MVSATVGVSYTKATPIKPTDTAQEEQNYIFPWQETVIQIEDAKQAGKITLNQAAIYRYYALTDSSQLPSEFQPEAPYIFHPHRDGLLEGGLQVQALFIDQENWSVETRSFIETQMARMDQQLETILDSYPDTYLTTNFALHYDRAKTPQSFVVDVGDGLEDAWATYESADFGYQMPEPSDYGGTRFNVHIPHYDPNNPMYEICGLSFAGATTLPGQMWISDYWLNDSHNLDIYVSAHELYHLLQWNYIDLTTGTGCRAIVQAFGYYAYLGRWLMEGTAMWMQDEVDTGDNSYLDDYAIFLEQPTTSLFAGTDLTQRREYGVSIFAKFLQENLSSGYAQSREIIRSIWEQAGTYDLIDATTYVLLNPPGGSPPWSDYAEVWQNIMADFGVANYLQDYAEWPTAGASVAIELPISPSANPSTPITIYEDVAFEFNDPSARYYEIKPDNLNLPGGADQTGATLHLYFETDCTACSLDVLEINANGNSTRTQHLINANSYPLDEDISVDFGSPLGTSKVILVLTNGSSANGIWGINRNCPFCLEDFTYYTYTLTATDSPPKAPQNLTATATNGNYPIHLNWDAIDETGIKYNVYMNDTFPFPLDDTTRISTQQTGTTYDISTGSSGTFFFIVTSVDTGTNESTNSNIASIEVSPVSTATPTPSPTANPAARKTLTPPQQPSPSPPSTSGLPLASPCLIPPTPPSSGKEHN